MPQGSFGEIRAFNDFNASYEDLTWADTSVELGGGWAIVSEQEGTMNMVTDEDGGVLQFLTDTGDDDSVCLFSGLYKASNGPLSIEARFKIADDITKGAVFCGFMETLAMAIPIFPITTSGTTLTYTGAGGMVGMLWDPDRTTNAWLAVCGDGGAASNTTNYPAAGTAATDAMILDEYDIVRVNLYPSGFAEIWHDEELVASGQTSLTTTDSYYAVLMCENRDSEAEEFEVDYVAAKGVRDWTV